MSSTYQIAVLTIISLVAFAANSLLCRAALGAGLIDPTSFTSVRVASGAVALALLARATSGASEPRRAGSWVSALALFAYAIFFSWAYVSLNTATGALVLFGAVQITMIASGLRRGERLSALRWLGVLLAAGGLTYLLLPGASAPSPLGAASMASAGAAWGLYTLRGRGAGDPLRTNAANFARAALPAVALSIASVGLAHVSARGLALAAISGALTSGVGYAVWYRALRGHSSTSAAVVQLMVPIIAAAGGALLLGELPSLRLATAALLTLGGIAVTLLPPARRP